jgi:hypothetical protein
MKRRDLLNTLADHADQMMEPSTSRIWTGTRTSQVQGLLDLAEQLHGVLMPVKPNVSFRRRLHGELLLEAQRRQVEPLGLSHKLESPPNLFRQHRKGILIGAAAIGSVASVAGVIIAFVLRRRHTQATHIAAG